MLVADLLCGAGGSSTGCKQALAALGKPTSDQQRSDPWHIITWLRALVMEIMADAVEPMREAA